ncbi:hypothetical protein MKX01_000906 [Papaver californicum]|nr:hypothetical protein MKX01_000906 [Papaver californicum]
MIPKIHKQKFKIHKEKKQLETKISKIKLEDQEQEMKNQGHVWNIICGSVDSSVLKSSPSLSSLKADNLYRLLRYLSQMNLIAINSVEGNETFALTNLSRLLLKNQERSLKDWVLGDYCLSADDAPTPFVKLHRKTIWEFNAEVPEVSAHMNNAMACDTRMVMPAFVQGCNSILNGIKKLVDISGGTGAAMSYVVKAFPEIKCMVFDLPHVVAAALEIPGFMLDNWKDAECIQLLKRCKETIPADHGKVIIIEMVLDQNEDDDELTQARLSLDLDMMLSSGGKERTKDEWRILLEEAGFSKI